MSGEDRGALFEVCFEYIGETRRRTATLGLWSFFLLGTVTLTDEESKRNAKEHTNIWARFETLGRWVDEVRLGRGRKTRRDVTENP